MKDTLLTTQNMLAGNEMLATVTDRWLARLESALTAGDEGALSLLFTPES